MMSQQEHRSFARRAAAGCLLLAVGCGGGGGSNPVPAPDAEPAPRTPGLAGVLADEAGQPLGNTQVLACMATVCLFGQSEADGRFVFEIEPPAAIALKTQENLSRRPRRAAALYPVRLDDDTPFVDVGTLHVPDLPDGTRFEAASMDPQTLAAGDGLELTLRRADLTPRLGDILIDLAARRIPAAQVLPFPALGNEEIVAVYALHPFGARSASPISVRAPSSLPAGTPVFFRTIDEIDGHLSEPVPGHADGTVVATDPSVGITELSWLVISR